SHNGHTGDGNNVDGKIYGPNGSVIHILFGNWTTFLNMLLPDGSPQEVWRANPLPDGAAKYYGFNSLAMCLNEILQENLPPTDSRFRPDI
uniref:Uncharacterized protein n=1 Tax=Romanomermis culicivorax TaxID=13658 RepID=A0A915IZF1_ROMCU